MSELIEVSKNELSILCDGIIEGCKGTDYDDYHGEYDECKLCYATNKHGQLTHELDCPVLIAQSMKPNSVIDGK